MLKNYSRTKKHQITIDINSGFVYTVYIDRDREKLFIKYIR